MEELENSGANLYMFGGMGLGAIAIAASMKKLSETTVAEGGEYENAEKETFV